MGLKSIILAAASVAALVLPANAQLAGGPQTGVTLHDGTNFSGQAINVGAATTSLSGVRFNDKASSITVHSGTWEICLDSKFEGRCEVISSSVADLRALSANNQISSLRPASERPAPTGRPDRPAPLPEGVNADDAIIFWDDERQRGRAVSANSDIRNMNGLRFNDRARSVTVNSGVWQLCSDANFRGLCEYVGRNQRSLDAIGLAGNISSARLTAYEKSPGEYQISFFNHRDFGGEYLGFDEGVRNLSSYNFNDTAGSILVKRGTWLVCADADYRGRCEVVDASVDDLGLAEFGNTISSFRRYNPRRDGRYATGGLSGGGYGASTGGYGNDTGYGGHGRHGGQSGYGHDDGGRSNDRYRMVGQQSVFYPAPTQRNGERIRNGNGVATRFCQNEGYARALYKADGRLLADVLCQ